MFMGGGGGGVGLLKWGLHAGCSVGGLGQRQTREQTQLFQYESDNYAEAILTTIKWGSYWK